MLNNITDSWKHIPYTIRHYFAFMKLQKKVLGRYKYKFHDVDKIFMYLFLPFLGVEFIKIIHSRINKHHINDFKSTCECNYEEAILDWECARFTKPDKPETSYEFINSNNKSSHYFNLLETWKKMKIEK